MNRELPADWRTRIANGDRRILARAITLIEDDGPQAEAVHSALGQGRSIIPIVGFTGAPGVGKSTLIDAYVEALRQGGLIVGVVAVDPSSPRSGGAVLGDRARMLRHATDHGVYVRSLAARGHLGGLTRSFSRILDLLHAADFDLLIVETVGTGQSEVQLADVATTNVVVCAPGMGDELQAIKAGILEIADIAVVNKADQLAAGPTLSALQDALHRSSTDARWTVPVIETTATTGVGVAELAQMIARHGEAIGLARMQRLQVRQRLETRVLELARRRVRALTEAELSRLEHRLAVGEITETEAAQRVVSGFLEVPL